MSDSDDLESVDVLFQRVGNKLGWFQHKDLSEAMQSLSAKADRKKSRLKKASDQTKNVEKKKRRKRGEECRKENTPPENFDSKVEDCMGKIKKATKKTSSKKMNEKKKTHHVYEEDGRNISSSGSDITGIEHGNLIGGLEASFQCLSVTDSNKDCISSTPNEINQLKNTDLSCNQDSQLNNFSNASSIKRIRESSSVTSLDSYKDLKIEVSGKNSAKHCEKSETPSLSGISDLSIDLSSIHYSGSNLSGKNSKLTDDLSSKDVLSINSKKNDMYKNLSSSSEDLENEVKMKSKQLQVSFESELTKSHYDSQNIQSGESMNAMSSQNGQSDGEDRVMSSDNSQSDLVKNFHSFSDVSQNGADGPSVPEARDIMMQVSMSSSDSSLHSSPDISNKILQISLTSSSQLSQNSIQDYTSMKNDSHGLSIKQLLEDEANKQDSFLEDEISHQRNSFQDQTDKSLQVSFNSDSESKKTDRSQTEFSDTSKRNTSDDQELSEKDESMKTKSNLFDASLSSVSCVNETGSDKLEKSASMTSDSAGLDVSDKSLQHSRKKIQSGENMLDDGSGQSDSDRNDIIVLESSDSDNDNNFDFIPLSSESESELNNVLNLRKRLLKTKSKKDDKEKQHREKFNDLDSGEDFLPDLKTPVSVKKSTATQKQSSWRTSQESSSDEDLDSFFAKMRTPAKPTKPSPPKSFTLDDFIVSDSDCSEDSDDSVFYINTSRKIGRRKPGGKAKQHTQSTRLTKPSRTFTSSDSDSDIPDLSRPARRRVNEITRGDAPHEEIKPKKTSPKEDAPKSQGTDSVVCLSDDSEKEMFKTPKVLKKKTPGFIPKSAIIPRSFSIVDQSSKSRPRSAELPRFGFLKSLSVDVADQKRDLEARRFVKNFQKLRDELTAKLFRLFNKTVFEDTLPHDMSITWNKRLLKTAGFCAYKKDRSKPENRSARIELSVKVCDSAERVRNTLIHELCHAAVWLLNGKNDGHGPYWKYWASKANIAHPELPIIKRCHSYEVTTKYTYKCKRCGYQFGRHSKSLNTAKKVCGHCHGEFELLVNTKDGPAPATPKPLNPFARYVKDNYTKVKQANQGLAHKDVMALLSSQFAATKI